MDERQRIADQMRRAEEGDAWHGPSLRELLADVDAGRAATRAVPGAHTIWELVLHVAAARRLVTRRLAGDATPMTPEEDWPPPPPPTAEGWERARESLRSAGAELRAAVEALPPGRLEEPILPGSPSVYATLHGVVQHDLYHAGQIAVLRRAAGMGVQL